MKKWIINDVVYESDEINPGLSVSPWAGHRQFAYDLVSYLEPERIVELGTHYGCSFFAFLQACKDKSLSTEVIAIDCWEGDEQAGFYGEEVIDTVKKTISQKFSKQNYRLIRKYFEDSLGDIENESIDILHIDGLHTYEAVSKDYHSWLCKLKPNGIVLFHDVASELGYGSNIFWEEIQSLYPESYMFVHSWGLGVLFPKGNEYYKIFEKNNMSDKIKIYEYKAKFHMANKQLKDHIKMVEERDKALASSEKMIEERDEAIKANEELIRAKDKIIFECENLVRDKDAAIASNERMIEERDKAIKANEELIRAKDKIISECEVLISEKDKVIKSTENMIDERDRLIKCYEERLMQ